MPSPRAEVLFTRFAKNYALYEGETGSAVFVCPLCLREFSFNQIKELSEEHVPPGKLGGHVQTLTCRRCNNDQGASLESKAIDFLRLESFWNAKINTPPKIRFSASASASDDETKVAVDMKRHPTLGIEFNLASVRSNPEKIKAFKAYMSSSEPKPFNLGYEFDYGAAAVGLLRIAYLQVFSLLGYSAILHRNYDNVRRQINEYPKEILRCSWVTIDDNIPDHYLGLNVVCYPSTLRALFLGFEFQVEASVSQKVGVFMPGFDHLGIAIYKNLKVGKDSEFWVQPIRFRDSIPVLPSSTLEMWKDVLTAQSHNKKYFTR